MSRFVWKNFFIITSLFLCVFFATPTLAYVMGSTNYRIEKDSINAGGLDVSTSTNYGLSDSVGELATGVSTSSSFTMSAGYRQLEENFISITFPDSIVLSPSIGGVSGGVANGNGTWNIKTDCSAGYTLFLRTTSTPAMTSGVNSFADYTPVSASVPDLSWSLASANSEFGFSPYNPNSQAAKFKNNGSACNIGSNITDGYCWYPLGVDNETIAYKTSVTDIAGEDTKINFRAEVSSSGGIQPLGTYAATLVITAVSN